MATRYRYDPITKEMVAEESELEPTINLPWMEEPTTYSEIKLPEIKHSFPAFERNKQPTFNPNNPLVKGLDTLVGGAKSLFGFSPEEMLPTEKILPALIDSLSTIKQAIKPEVPYTGPERPEVPVESEDESFDIQDFPIDEIEPIEPIDLGEETELVIPPVKAVDDEKEEVVTKEVSAKQNVPGQFHYSKNQQEDGMYSHYEVDGNKLEWNDPDGPIAIIEDLMKSEPKDTTSGRFYKNFMRSSLGKEKIKTMADNLNMSESNLRKYMMMIDQQYTSLNKNKKNEEAKRLRNEWDSYTDEEKERMGGTFEEFYKFVTAPAEEAAAEEAPAEEAAAEEAPAEEAATEEAPVEGISLSEQYPPSNPGANKQITIDTGYGDNTVNNYEAWEIEDIIRERNEWLEIYDNKDNLKDIDVKEHVENQIDATNTELENRNWDLNQTLDDDNNIVSVSDIFEAGKVYARGIGHLFTDKNDKKNSETGIYFDSEGDKVKHGLHIDKDSRGRAEIVGKYENGNKVGVWIKADSKIKTRPAIVKIYDNEGNLIKTIKFKPPKRKPAKPWHLDKDKDKRLQPEYDFSPPEHINEKPTSNEQKKQWDIILQQLEEENRIPDQKADGRITKYVLPSE